MRPQHRLFAAEYIRNGGNGVQAVFKAGYKLGYDAACVRASTLLRSIKVKSMIDEITEQATIDAKLTEERVRKEIAKVAFSKVKDIDSKAKMQGLSLATQVLGMVTQKVEQTVTDNSSVQIALARRISKISQKTGESQQIVEKELQIELSDKSDEDYSAELDASVHPEVWPSGNLLQSNELAPTQIEGEQ